MLLGPEVERHGPIRQRVSRVSLFSVVSVMSCGHIRARRHKIGDGHCLRDSVRAPVCAAWGGYAACFSAKLFYVRELDDLIYCQGRHVLY